MKIHTLNSNQSESIAEAFDAIFSNLIRVYSPTSLSYRARFLNGEWWLLLYTIGDDKLIPNQDTLLEQKKELLELIKAYTGELTEDTEVHFISYPKIWSKSQEEISQDFTNQTQGDRPPTHASLSPSPEHIPAEPERQ